MGIITIINLPHNKLGADSFFPLPLCTDAFSRFCVREWEVRSWSLWRQLRQKYHTTPELYINPESNPERRERRREENDCICLVFFTPRPLKVITLKNTVCKFTGMHAKTSISEKNTFSTVYSIADMSI